MQRPPEPLVERADVARGQTARGGNRVTDLGGHLGHETQRAAARGLRDQHAVTRKRGERVERKLFGAQLTLDRIYEVLAERSQIRAVNVRAKH